MQVVLQPSLLAAIKDRSNRVLDVTSLGLLHLLETLIQVKL